MTTLEGAPLDDWPAFDRAALLRQSMASAPAETGFGERPYWRRPPPLIQLAILARRIRKGEYDDDLPPPTGDAVRLEPPA